MISPRLLTRNLPAQSSSSSSSVLISFSCSIRPITSFAVPESPNPSRCRVASSSNPERLARCFLRGLPTMPSSKSLGVLRSWETLVKSVGGVAALLGTSGGVDPRVGVLEAGDFRVAGDPSFSSAECCLLSCEEIRRALKSRERVVTRNPPGFFAALQPTPPGVWRLQARAYCSNLGTRHLLVLCS